ncbi:MAG: SIMPL domain-containing protein [bacterium]
MAIKKDVNEVIGMKKFLELNSLLKIVSILFILSITVLATVNIFERKEGDSKNQNQIVVSGHSEINVAPDTTKFTISATESGKDIKSSQDAVTRKINDAILILKQNGVLDKNIKTANFNTYPRYSSRTAACGTTVPSTSGAVSVGGKGVQSSVVAPSSLTSLKTPSIATGSAAVNGKAVVSSKAISVPNNCLDKTTEIIGYDTNQSIEVKLVDITRNPSLAGTLVTAIGRVGVQVSDITSYLDSLDKVKETVRDQAIKKAKVQAEIIAGSLGIKLGKITSFSENSGGGSLYPMMSYKMSSVSADTATGASLPVGEDKISSDVSITYNIK